MTPSQLLRLAKTRLATPEDVSNKNPYKCICHAVDAIESRCNITREVGNRIKYEITKIAPRYLLSFYPDALAISMGMGIEDTDDQWRQKVRHEFVDRLIAEYEAVGR